MIEFLTTWDFAYIQVRVFIILICWLLSFVAVMVDTWSGAVSARARGVRVYSGGLRRAFSKMGDYWRILLMGFIFDIIASFIAWYSLPFATMLIAAAVCIIEGLSVVENEKAKKSNAGKLPEYMAELLRSAKRQDIETLLNVLKNDKEITKGIEEQ